MTKLPATFLLFIFSLIYSDDATSQTLVIDGSTGVKPLVESLVKHYEGQQGTPRFVIGSGLKPHLRLQALKDKQIDIAMASHGIDIKQIASAGFKVHKIAKVAVVIGVNKTVQVDGITHSQLCDVYSGKVSNWSTLHGRNMAITPFIRPLNEVDSEVISAHIPCFAQLKILDNIETMQKSGQMAKALSTTLGAVGMTTQIRVAQSHSQIRVLAINNIQPSPTNIVAGTYPFTRDLFLITAAQPSAEVSGFMAFIRSKLGAKIIIDNNAAPVSVRIEV